MSSSPLNAALARVLAIVVMQLRVRLVSEQYSNRIQMTVVAGQHQQAVALVVLQIGRQATL